MRSLRNSIGGIDTPRQLALGLAMGCIVGILPKDNLIFAGLLVCMIGSGANLITGALSGLGASLLAGPMQPVTHSIGLQFLGAEYIIAPLTKFLQLPLAPWTRLDNTVVSGSLILGLIAFLPIYVSGLIVFRRYRESIEKLFVQSSLATWIVGYPADEEE
jgi:uncharacterized protein (TIGR03546 family)